jgi:hypothetical protein
MCDPRCAMCKMNTSRGQRVAGARHERSREGWSDLVGVPMLCPGPGSVTVTPRMITRLPGEDNESRGGRKAHSDVGVCPYVFE